MDIGVQLVMVNIARCDWCYRITAVPQIIGRSTDVAIPIPGNHQSVSRRHAEIWFEKSEYCLRDLGARGGTRVNSIWLQPQQPAVIVVGDRLSLGGCELRLEPVVTSDLVAEQNGAGHTDEESTLDSSETRTRKLLETLTNAEHNILLWMGRGYVHDSDLSKLLHRSPHTIRTQIGNILKKLNLRSRPCILDVLQRDSTALRINRATRDFDVP